MRYLSLFIMLFLITGCSTQSKNCSKFRTGTFKYPNPEFKNFIITRNDSTQIEVNKQNNDRLISAIEWLSDCKYTLTYIEVSNPKDEDLLNVKITVDVTNISGNSYTYHAYNNDDSIIGEMLKIKDSHKH